MVDEIKEKYWGRFSATYDKNQEFVVGKDFLNEVKIALNNFTDLGEVLELGCGTGYFTESIVKNAKHIFATDLSEELLEKARERLGDNDKITFQKENGMAITFVSNKFDTVFMANVIHVIENPQRVLQECYRVLKDNGLLVITSFTNHGMKLSEIIKLGFRFIKVWGKPPRHTHFSPNSLCSLIESTGFSIEESKILGNRVKSLFLTGRKNN